MIYMTGDTHIPIDIHKLTTQYFPQQKELTKKDYLIIRGVNGELYPCKPDIFEKTYEEVGE